VEKVYKGALFTEGKTKEVYCVKGDDSKVIIQAKDDITARNGGMHNVIFGKAHWATGTTCNVFQLLKACGIQLAFERQIYPTKFIAAKCTMLPYEVVVRRVADGSYLKRKPHLKKGHIFPKLILEFFLKTTGCKWGKAELVCDDPLMKHDGDKILLFKPYMPSYIGAPFLELDKRDVYKLENEESYFPKMSHIAQKVFLILERAWELAGCRLVDLKLEFGIDQDGNMLIADVIDNDSWRVINDGQYLDKQVYRDGGEFAEVARKYKRVQKLTEQFKLPRQRIILWRGSPKDDALEFIRVFHRIFGECAGSSVDHKIVTCSIHKETERGINKLRNLAHEVPDMVIVANVGMSNAAGPVLSGITLAPVISVPANYKEFKEDVWSSARMPSDVPPSTILGMGDAVLHAAGIHAMRNSHLYSILRMKQEERFDNTAPI